MADNDPFIIGFSDSVHDRSVCLLHGNRIVAGIEEERLSRVKHGLSLYGMSRTDPGLFAQMNLENSSAVDNEARLMPAVAYCLDAAGIGLKDVAFFAGNSLHVGFPFRGRSLYINHHLAHAASAFYTSGFDEAAILLADGYGDVTASQTYETVMLAAGRGRDIEVLQTVSGRTTTYYDMENSIGVFYRIGTLLAGFGLFDEGKAMGLAGYGRPRHLDLVRQHLTFTPDAVRIDNKAVWDTCRAHLRGHESFEARADIAATFQALLEEMMLHYARRLRDLTGLDALCVAGGVGLNCVCNARLLSQSGFRDVFVVPAPGDNGISLGAAYYAAHAVLRLPRAPRMAHAYLGRGYGDQEHQAALDSHGGRVAWEILDQQRIAAKAARLLHDGQVVMWFQGGAEMGPRALGHRSILASPVKAETRDFINAHVKFREMFRPLAPIVLEDRARDYFDCAAASPFMLFSPPVKPATRDRAPAIVHVDGTARLQTLAASANPLLHRVIREFEGLSGVPIVLNTSFNGKDEPIVETPDQALRTFLASPVQHLFLGSHYVTKKDGPSP